MVADIDRAGPIVTVRDADEFRRRPLATIGNALEGGTGVMVQQSTYGQVSPFLRGPDRLSRAQPDRRRAVQQLDVSLGSEPVPRVRRSVQAQRIEAMLGPASSQFGSDALGGAIQAADAVAVAWQRRAAAR